MTNETSLLKALSDGSSINPNFQPQNNKQAYLAYLCGLKNALPEPRTVEEILLYKLCINGTSGNSKPEQEKSVDITENGTTEIVADKGYALSKVTANVNVKSSGSNKLAQLVDGSITEITAEDFGNATEIKPYLFSKCNTLTTVTVPDSVASIGNHAFFQSTMLEKIILPDNITELGDKALMACFRLEEIRIPEGVTVLPDALFYQGTGYASKTGEFNIYLPSALTKINGSEQFGITFFADLPLPPEDAKSNINIYFPNQQVLNVWINRLCIQSRLTGNIRGKMRFYLNGEQVTNITIPATGTVIGKGAFAYLENLNVVCEGNIKTIYCELYDKTCYGVKNISFLNNTQVPALSKKGTDIFNVESIEQIKVPAALYDEWIASTNWASVADFIVAV